MRDDTFIGRLCGIPHIIFRGDGKENSVVRISKRVLIFENFNKTILSCENRMHLNFLSLIVNI
jgi:hypothetical protein